MVDKWLVTWLMCVCCLDYTADALINDLCDPKLVADADPCHITHAYCQPVERALHGLCTCLKGFTASRYERHCLPLLGVPCAADTDCLVRNAACSSAGRCACIAQHVQSQDKTACIPPLGRSCRTNCDGDIPGAACVDGACVCGKQYVASHTHTKCLPVLGQYCAVNSDCTVTHSRCSNGLCACPRDKYVDAVNKTVCLPLVSHILGEACVQDTQCTLGKLGRDTACVNQRCVCRYGNTAVNRTCDPRKELDDWCTHTQQCQVIEHASCVQNKCSCNPYYVAAPGNRSHCVPIALLYGSSCSHRVQCKAGFGEGSDCKDGSCVCLNDYHFVVNYTGRCIPNRVLGETCTHAHQCYLPRDGAEQRVTCVDNACTCQQGYQQNDVGTTCSGAATLHATLLILLASVIVGRRELIR